MRPSKDDLATIVTTSGPSLTQKRALEMLGGKKGWLQLTALWWLLTPWKVTLTLPETKIAPKIWWFEYYFPIGGGLFSGAMLVSGRVYFERCSSIYEQSTSNIGKSTFISGLVNASHFCSFNSLSTLSEVQQRSHVLGPFIWYPQDNKTSTKKDQVSFP